MLLQQRADPRTAVGNPTGGWPGSAPRSPLLMEAPPAQGRPWGFTEAGEGEAEGRPRVAALTSRLVPHPCQLKGCWEPQRTVAIGQQYGHRR